jgi:THAP4-like, heme-binding beta-barrel domain
MTHDHNARRRACIHRYRAAVDGPRLHPDVAAVAVLLGTWRGEGRGVYPTIPSFQYDEEVEFVHTGKPFLVYGQRSWARDDGRPLHMETGYWRPAGAGRVELVLAHPNGITEVEEGTVEATATGIRLSLATTAVARTGSAKEVTALTRTLEVDGDVLRSRVDMAAVGRPLQRHLEAELHRTTRPESGAWPPTRSGPLRLRRRRRRYR